MLSGVGVTELLNSAPNLFRGSTLARGLEDIVRNKLVTHWQTTQSLRGPRACRLVLLQTCNANKLEHFRNLGVNNNSITSMSAASRAGGQTGSLLPLRILQHLRPERMVLTALVESRRAETSAELYD